MTATDALHIIYYQGPDCIVKLENSSLAFKYDTENDNYDKLLFCNEEDKWEPFEGSLSQEIAFSNAYITLDYYDKFTCNIGWLDGEMVYVWKDSTIDYVVQVMYEFNTPIDW